MITKLIKGRIHVQKQIAIYALLWSLLVHFVQSTARSPAGTRFPKCVNVKQKCAALGCTKCKFTLLAS